MIELRKVNKENKQLLFNIFQKMLYEMTQFYDDPMDELGNYHYGYFDEYFIDKKRIAYLIYNDEILIGFIMLHPYSYFESCDVNVAEFTIFPNFRKNGLGIKAVNELFSLHQGKYEIKYNLKNFKAVEFWHKVTSKYNPIINKYSDVEEVIIFEVK